jgi:peroxiredoxin (alkyl hydroperoxide reductase subunit C)
MRYLILVILLGLAGCVCPFIHKCDCNGADGAPGETGTASLPTLVTHTAPDFTAEAAMPDGSFKEITLSSYRGKYVALFFYPMDFTFVCPTEIVAFNTMLDDFWELDCEVLGVSTDSKFTHLAWRNLPLKEGGIGAIDYPLIADINKKISRSYGVLHDESVALRGLFLIDREGAVRHALVNDLSLGRSIEEVIRTLKALRMIDQYGEFCPADWKPGDKTIQATKKSMEEYFSDKQ